MVISVELVTVLLDGPGAVYICYLISKIANVKDAALQGQYQSRLWFAAIVVATLELVGGWYTFAPEWLSGNHSLAGDDPVYLWLYLVFFNTLCKCSVTVPWESIDSVQGVFIPCWVLYLAYSEIYKAFTGHNIVASAKKTR